MSPRGERIALRLLLSALLLTLILIAWPFARAVVLATIMATVLHPANRWLTHRLRRPGLASLLTVLATLILFWGTSLLVWVAVVKDAAHVQQSFSQHSLEQGGWPGMVAGTTGRIADALARRLPVQKETIRDQVLATMKAGAHYLVGKTSVIMESMVSFLFTIVLANIFLYYLLRHGERWLQTGTALVPLSPRITSHLLQAAHHSLVANVYGVLIVALAQGSFLSLGFWFVGLGSPLLWGMFGAIASVIPLVGAALVWIPAVVGLVIMGSYGKALALGLWAGLVVGSLDNFLRPWVVGAREKRNPVLIGFAMLGGTYTLGALGLLYGPLLVSLAGAVVEELHNLDPISRGASLDSANDAAEQMPKPTPGPASLFGKIDRDFRGSKQWSTFAAGLKERIGGER